MVNRNVMRVQNYDPETKERAKVTNGGLDVNIQDQTTDIIDYYMCKSLIDLELSEDAIIDENTVNVVDATGVNTGSYVCIQEGPRAFQAQILSVSVNELTLDTPLDYPFTTAASIANRTPDMNVNGSLTKQSFTLAPTAGVKWDVTRIIFVMTHTSSGSDDKFGNLDALTNGIVLRKSDGIHHTIFNAKTNGDLRERMYDLNYAAAIGQAKDSTSGRRSFAGQDKNGVTIRLDGDEDDKLELLIQDDLLLLSSFRIIAQGHVVE